MRLAMGKAADAKADASEAVKHDAAYSKGAAAGVNAKLAFDGEKNAKVWWGSTDETQPRERERERPRSSPFENFGRTTGLRVERCAGYYRLGQACESLREYAEAIAAFESGAALEPTSKVWPAAVAKADKAREEWESRPVKHPTLTHTQRHFV